MDLNKFLPHKLTNLALMTLMTIEADFVATDPVSESLIFDDGLILPISLLKQEEENDDEWIFHYDFQVKQIFEESDGKYSTVFGNAVFIDCNYVYVTLIKSIKAQITPEMFHGKTELYNNVTKALDRIDEWV